MADEPKKPKKTNRITGTLKGKEPTTPERIEAIKAANRIARQQRETGVDPANQLPIIPDPTETPAAEPQTKLERKQAKNQAREAAKTTAPAAVASKPEPTKKISLAPVPPPKEVAPLSPQAPKQTPEPPPPKPPKTGVEAIPTKKAGEISNKVKPKKVKNPVRKVKPTATTSGAETCLAKAAVIAGGKMDYNELVAAFNEAADIKQKEINSGLPDDINARVRDALAKSALQKKRDAAAQKLRAQQHQYAVADGYDAYKTRASEGMKPKQAMLSLFHGTIKAITGGRVSVARQRLAYSSKLVGTFFGNIAKDRAHVLKLLHDPQFDEAVTRELAEIKPGGQSGITGNSDALYIAQLANKQLMQSRIIVNRFGANIRDSVGYVGPEAHNDVKIIGREDEWIKHMKRNALNLEASFPGLDPQKHAKEIDTILKEAFGQIVTGKNNAFGTVLGARSKLPPISSNFVFKNSDAIIAYQKEFGYTSTISSIINTLESRAHDAALMEMFGHDPRRTLNKILEMVRADIEAKGGTKTDTLGLHEADFDQVMNIATGQVNHIQHHTMAKVMSEVRATGMMAYLGKALLAAIPSDTVLMASASMFRGDGFLRGFMGAIFKSMDGLTPGERMAAAYLYGEGFDGLNGHLSRASLAEDGRIGMLSRHTGTYFYANGLTPWTDSRRAISARMIAAQLGRESNKEWDQIGWRLQNVLRQNNILERDWNDIRSLVQTGPNGNKYIYPEGFDKLTHLTKYEKDKLEMNLRGYIADEVNFGMLEGDAAAKYLSPMAYGQRGTYVGEAIRTISMFTTFPQVFGHRILGRSFLGVPGSSLSEKAMRSVPHAGMMMASMLAAGYAGWILKEMAKGNTPPMPTEDNYLEFGSKILIDSGVAGYYGSMVIDGIINNRGMGMGPVSDSIAAEGQVLHNLLVGDFEKAGTIQYDTILNNTPYANLFYLRPVLDLLFLNSIDEIMHPERARKQEKRRETFGQSRIWGE
jgi:hypothetical protein